MELKPHLRAVLSRIQRLTQSRAPALLGIVAVAGVLSVLVWHNRFRVRPTTATAEPISSPAAATLAGAPEQGRSAAGEILPVMKRLEPQVGHALIRYFPNQSPKAPHGSFVESAVDSTKVFWFRLKECQTERTCPFWPWWRKADVMVMVVPDDFVVGVMQPDNICHGLLRVNPDSDYSLACRGTRLRVVSAPSGWRGTGSLPKTEWLAAPWDPQQGGSGGGRR